MTKKALTGGGSGGGGGGAIKIATWNINSVRLRLDLARAFVKRRRPDILCLQETKCPDEDFPEKSFREMGFRDVMFRGQKAYHGVAIASRLPLERQEWQTFGSLPHARHIAARFGEGRRSVLLHNVYVPAGGDLPDPDENEKFAHKLAFLDDMTRFFQNQAARPEPMILLGDFNIAPRENDVWSHRQLLKVVSHTPIEVARLKALADSLRWIDIARARASEDQKLYTWWSYRARDWAASDRGRRLDHIWATPDLEKRLGALSILRQIRGCQKPSDHVPVMLDFRL